MSKINWRLIGVVTLWVLSLSAVISSLAFTEIKQQRVLCRSISIHIERDDENYFINKDDIRAILFSAGDSLIGTEVNAIPISLLERLLNKNKYVQQAHVFVDIKGNLQVNLEQRKPLLRLWNSAGNSFYIDHLGMKMPLSPLYSARVLVANGSIEELYDGMNDSLKMPISQELFYLAKHVQASEFWDAQVEQIFVEPNHDLIIIPRIGEHRIVLGDTSRLEEKLNDLMVFYQKALPKVGWDTYSKISVKYKGQVICTKKNANITVLPSLVDTVNNKIDTVTVL